jgi:hypothetical protein
VGIGEYRGWGPLSVLGRVEGPGASEYVPSYMTISVYDHISKNGFIFRVREAGCLIGKIILYVLAWYISSGFPNKGDISFSWGEICVVKCLFSEQERCLSFSE